jgi:hypothetical protein
VRERISREDELMERTAHYGWYAERYGWTQEQVDRQNKAWYLDRLPAFAEIWDEVAAEKQKAASKQ